MPSPWTSTNDSNSSITIDPDEIRDTLQEQLERARVNNPPRNDHVITVSGDRLHLERRTTDTVEEAQDVETVEIYVAMCETCFHEWHNKLNGTEPDTEIECPNCGETGEHIHTTKEVER